MEKDFSGILDIPGKCPNPKCEWSEQKNIPQGIKWYRCHGYYPSEQHGKMPRYQCLKCGKTFSLRTAHKDCYLHFDCYDIQEMGKAWLDGKCLGEIARDYNISVQMVRTRLKRFDGFVDGEGSSAVSLKCGK